MVVIFGEPTVAGAQSSENWENCLEKCWDTWNCVLISKLTSGCEYYYIGDTVSVDKVEKNSQKRVALKLPVTQGLCSISTDAPLFGSPSASVVATNGTEFYYQTMVTDNGTFCSFQYGLWTCLKDVPEEYESLEGMNSSGYRHSLNGAPFSPGETFFMKGRISAEEDLFSISFLEDSTQNYPVYIKLNNKRTENFVTTEIATWKDSDIIYWIDNQTNPYSIGDEFTIYVNSSETQAFIYLDNTKIVYDLQDGFPLSPTTAFVINISGGTVIMYFVGWTGDCWVWKFKYSLKNKFSVRATY
ncbi:PAN-3 domain-containing protein [Caenorhabditis elegans]|uniref:PAN-3 domain-containing protein n=1 Tax=Caenorhabditis elegans TaxID=6239 RepID=A4F307_CAEEL|nr:PAN-3 domain-containing protein [Caenorhabditis elegans]CCD63955.2 PAN-3 domain-containing protein [Caenorhabditis elegans]|eukprot:NP_741306.2 Uncharacterized protein CELE_F38A1.11 [Caenorhabditis elegans]